MKLGMTRSQLFDINKTRALQQELNPREKFAYFPTYMDDTGRYIWWERYWLQFHIPWNYKYKYKEWYKGYWRRVENLERRY